MSLAIFSSLTQDPGDRIGSFIDALHVGPLAILDLVIVGAILYWLYSTLRETRALGIIYGIFVLVLGYIVSKILRLELLAFLIANFLTLLFVAIPVLFQPELRRLLERLGRARGGPFKSLKKTESQVTVEIVSEAARILSQSHTGALVVFKRTTGLSDLMTSGTSLDARLSTSLLLNLFFDKSPLHDGAVIIDEGRILAAGVMLPLSEKEYGYTLGARHRAAVGLTEQSDAVVLVVSEEKGIISLVVGGKITPGIQPDVLPDILTEFLASKQPRSLGRHESKKREKPAKAGKPKPKAS
jgi:diadenylate cyclase